MKIRTRKLLSSKFRRALRWEFWPMPIFYAPVVIYIIVLTIRYRGLTFLSVNPGLPMSGLIGERKGQTLAQLNESPFLARFDIIPSELAIAARTELAQTIMRNLAVTYPVVLKPDFGQRGQGVAVIRTRVELERYLEQASTDTILQEHVAGEEFGVFYMRYPAEGTARVFSITEKTFPVLTGDGQSTLEELLMANPRTHYMAEFLLNLHRDRLAQVLEKGETFKAVEIGSHCRGSVFLDGDRYISELLTQQIDQISRAIDGFYFGRYDLRVPTSAELMAGDNFKILEVNGVTSESTNIYDPSHSVLKAYRILFSQWREAFKIGQQAISLGAPKVSLKQLLQHLKTTYT